MDPDALINEIETEVVAYSLAGVMLFEIKNQKTVKLRLTGRSVLIYGENEDSIAFVRGESTIRVIKYAESGDMTGELEGGEDYLMAIHHVIEKMNIILCRIEDRNLENFKTDIEAILSKT